MVEVLDELFIKEHVLDVIRSPRQPYRRVPCRLAAVALISEKQLSQKSYDLILVWHSSRTIIQLV